LFLGAFRDLLLHSALCISFNAGLIGRSPEAKKDERLNNNNNNNNNNAVVRSDDSYTPLYFLHANENELATYEEYNNKVKKQWSPKLLHGRHLDDLSQKHVDIEASNKRLTSADLFAKTGSSHTNKKLQEIYFEAAKHR
jgi:hypothetical protein